MHDPVKTKKAEMVWTRAGIRGVAEEPTPPPKKNNNKKTIQTKTKHTHTHKGLFSLSSLS